MLERPARSEHPMHPLPDWVQLYRPVQQRHVRPVAVAICGLTAGRGSLRNAAVARVTNRVWCRSMCNRAGSWPPFSGDTRTNGTRVTGGRRMGRSRPSRCCSELAIIHQNEHPIGSVVNQQGPNQSLDKGRLTHLEPSCQLICLPSSFRSQSSRPGSLAEAYRGRLGSAAPPFRRTTTGSCHC